MLGVLTGAAVAVFGMWAFLYGQRAMYEIVTKGAPEGMKNPVRTLREIFQNEEAGQDEPDYPGQLRDMFRDGAPRR